MVGVKEECPSDATLWPPGSQSNRLVRCRVHPKVSQAGLRVSRLKSYTWGLHCSRGVGGARDLICWKAQQSQIRVGAPGDTGERSSTLTYEVEALSLLGNLSLTHTE